MYTLYVHVHYAVYVYIMYYSLNYNCNVRNACCYGNHVCVLTGKLNCMCGPVGGDFPSAICS